MSAIEVLLLVLLAGLAGLVWLLPAYIAFRRGVADVTSILLVDVFLGLSPVAWLLLLVWALMGKQRPASPDTDAAAAV